MNARKSPAIRAKRVDDITFANTYVNTNIGEIKGRLDIVGLVSETVQLSRKGNNYWGLCPFHAEKTPSFSVSRDKQKFKCFGCSVGGDVFDFIRLRDGVDFRGARDYLAARAGLREDICPVDRKAIEAARAERKTKNRRQEMAREIIRAEWSRLIGLERRAHWVLQSVRLESDWEHRAGLKWAIETITCVEPVLDRWERADDAERLRIALAVRGWKP